YYLYGALSLLDTPTEWYLGGGTLYLWTPDGASPAAHTVEVKMRATAFVLDNCSYVTVSNLYVFAAGISMNNTLNCVVDNCHLRYVQHNTTADWEHDVNYPISAACTVSGNGSVWRNSSIFISSQDGLQLNGTSAMVTNCVISDVDYYPGSFYACLFPASGSGQKIFRNTLTRAGEGVLQGVQQGARVFPVNYEVAYNDVSWGGYFAQDVGGIYLAFHLDTQGSRIHHNWVHDMCAGNLDNGNSTGIYLDNATTNGIVYRNVAYNNGVGIRMNSPNITNLVYNNTCLQNPLGSIATDNTSSTMAGSRVINNICDSGLTLTSDCTANHNGRYLPVGTNFVPQAGSGAIDGGAILPGYTDGYVGSAPDIGAYESGGTYWTPGANFSIPPFPTPGSTAAPVAPTGLAAAPATNVIGVSLSWTPSPMAVSYYNVKRAGAVGGTLTNVAAVIAGTIYTDTNVAAGQTYFYAVSAVNSSGESAADHRRASGSSHSLSSAASWRSQARP
ncbi:MAG: hypothetical protein WCG36_08840, partial [bacterium]